MSDFPIQHLGGLMGLAGMALGIIAMVRGLRTINRRPYTIRWEPEMATRDGAAFIAGVFSAGRWPVYEVSISSSAGPELAQFWSVAARSSERFLMPYERSDRPVIVRFRVSGESRLQSAEHRVVAPSTEP